MFVLKTLPEAYKIIEQNFNTLNVESEIVPLFEAKGRLLAKDIYATEYVPSFNRSSVDGYAVIASDTFGSSDSIPSILNIQEQILMGEEVHFTLNKGFCAAIPTGGAVPDGADAVQMIEYTEDYGDNSVGILKAVAPGQHIILKGDDVHPDKLLFKAGARISAKDIGALSALGICNVEVKKQITVGIIATGDELVEIHEKPNNAQVRCVNSGLLQALAHDFGVKSKSYGIIKDNEQILHDTVATAAKECDVVLISGGSSVGVKDVTSNVIATQGEILFHGVALKPGKPTIMGKIGHTPVIGLPGHPVAVFFVTLSIVYKVLETICDVKFYQAQINATLAESVEANHGRAQFVPVIIEEQDGQSIAHPIRNKSGLITTLASAHGYFIIPQDCEGYAKNTPLTVYIF